MLDILVQFIWVFVKSLGGAVLTLCRIQLLTRNALIGKDSSALRCNNRRKKQLHNLVVVNQCANGRQSSFMCTQLCRPALDQAHGTTSHSKV